MAYKGSSSKVPTEYWEYRLVEEHFRGNWELYWSMPDPWIEMIVGFRAAENEATRITDKRLIRQKENGRTANGFSDSN